MKKLLSLLLTLCLLAACLASAAADPADTADPAAAAGSGQNAPREDNLAVTKHTTVIQGKEISYTVTTGFVAMSTDLGDYDLFITAYTLDGAEDPSKRPITFAYNGGPGAASMYINLGLLGPDHLALDEQGKMVQVPTGTVPNDYSLLDITDLVFIDPVGTGYSRAANDTDPDVFYSYPNDIRSVGDFILLYINRNQRWASPKYLAGESYGTTRTAGLCDYLMSQGHMNLNGLIMVSSINNYAAVAFSDGNELPYAGFIPTFAAVAHYHGKVADAYRDMDLETFLDEVRDFAGGEYWTALYRGSRLTDAEKDALAEKMAGYIGLPKELILENNLRIDGDTFCTELLRDKKMFVGRIDGRVTGPALSGDIGSGAADPSSAGTDQAYADAMRDLITRKHQFRTDVPYSALSIPVNEAWKFPDQENAILSQERIIHDCMSKNPQLKVWVICGYYDLATPFFSAEWTYSHLFLMDGLKDNLSFTYYQSGHMFYQHEPSLRQFRKDAEAWFSKETPGSGT